MKVFFKIIFLAFIFISFDSCRKSSENGYDKPVVTVDQKVLTLGQLCAAVPDNLSKDDSTLFANDFQKRWVKSKLLLQRAELNLTPDEKNVDDLLDEYRSSLLIYKYQAKMVEQKYSSLVSDADIDAYYRSSSESFKLWEPFVKGVFIKVPKFAPNIELVESKYRSLRSSDLTDLEGYCFQNAKSYLLFPDQWKSLSSISEQLPVAVPALEEVLRRDKFYASMDGEYRYYIAIHDIMSSGEVAPIESVKDRVRAILANKKRLDFIKKMESDLYEDGIITGTVKFYK